MLGNGPRRGQPWAAGLLSAIAEAMIKPDYGLRLLKDGYSPTTNLYFYEFRLFSISVLGNGDYSTMVEQRYDGELHALSLDFNHAQLEQILVGADPTLAAFIRAELKNPFPRTIDQGLAGPSEEEG